jgi:hypothetical protein
MAPPIPLTIFPGNHPVGEVTPAGNLQTAQDRGVDVSAADHPEREGRVEEGGAGMHGDRLLAGVDEVRVDLILRGIRPGAQNPVLRVQHDVDTRGQVVGDQSRQSDAQVDVLSVDHLGSRPRGHLLA